MDGIGPFQFVRWIGGAPQRPSAEWELVARAGIDGVALYNTGVRGEPFELISEAVALNHVLGSAFLINYKSLERLGPVGLSYGTIIPDLFYKVLKVEWQGPGPKRVPRVHVAGDTTWYTCLVYARWRLLAIDPFVQQP